MNELLLTFDDVLSTSERKTRREEVPRTFLTVKDRRDIPDWWHNRTTTQASIRLANFAISFITSSLPYRPWIADSGVHCLPWLAAWRDACTRPGPDAVVVCHCCVYNFTLSARRHVTLTSQQNMLLQVDSQPSYFTIRYDTIEEINVDSKAEYTA